MSHPGVSLQNGPDSKAALARRSPALRNVVFEMILTVLLFLLRLDLPPSQGESHQPFVVPEKYVRYSPGHCPGPAKLLACLGFARVLSSLLHTMAASSRLLVER